MFNDCTTRQVRQDCRVRAVPEGRVSVALLRKVESEPRSGDSAQVVQGALQKTHTVLLSKVCGTFCSTKSTLVGSAKVMKPKPLDRPVSGFFMTTQSTTSPYRLKYRSKLSCVVSQLKPPINIFLQQNQPTRKSATDQEKHNLRKPSATKRTREKERARAPCRRGPVRLCRTS